MRYVANLFAFLLLFGLTKQGPEFVISDEVPSIEVCRSISLELHKIAPDPKWLEISSLCFDTLDAANAFAAEYVNRHTDTI